jgi:predicted transcriptional regulator
LFPLAKKAGIRQPSIARLENGSSSLNLSFLERVAKAQDARVEIQLVFDEGQELD